MKETIEAEIVGEHSTGTQALAVRPAQQLATLQDLEQQFALAVRQRELLSEYIKKQLVPGKHFYQRGTQKPSLAKEGAEIILLPHNLAPDYVQTGGPEAPPPDGKPYQITVKCILRRKGDPGSFVGSGIGSAGSEKQLKDGSYQPRQNDKYLCHNATLKMAQKSAMIAATINSTAASEFFTQDMDPEPTEPRGKPPGRSGRYQDTTQAVKTPPKPSQEQEKPIPFPTEESRRKMIDALKANPGEPNRDICEEYFRKIENPAQLMPNEPLEHLPLRFVPATTGQMRALLQKIAEFGDQGLPASAAFPAHPEPDKPAPEAKNAAVAQETGKDPLWWRNVIISVPPKGMKRDDYMRHPDTIGALYDIRHGNDDLAQAARQRLWGMCQWEPKPREFKGKVYEPTDADRKSYEALQAFSAWFAANHPDERL